MRDEEQVRREPAIAEPRENGDGPAGGDGRPRWTGSPALGPDGDVVRPAVHPVDGVPAADGLSARTAPLVPGDGASGGAAPGGRTAEDGMSGDRGPAATRAGQPPSGGEPSPGTTSEPSPATSEPPPGARGQRAAGGRGEPPGAGRGEAPAARPAKRRSFWRELPVLVIVALGLALLIKTFAVQAFFIPSSSMEGTLDIGDRVLVNKIVYHTRPIHRGDVVVFNGLDSWDPSVPQAPPSNPVRRFLDWIGSAFGVSAGEKDYIKRVIGVPGDQVRCCDAKGRVTVNGVPLSENSYLYPGNAPSATAFSITVPPGRLWVMGDHRAVSYDSRQHLGDPGGGSIPENKIVGRAFMIVWPVTRIRILPIPSTFEQKALSAPGPAGQAARVAVGAAPAAPALLGFAGAVPLTLLQRRMRLRYGRRRDGKRRYGRRRDGGRC